jgi:hypothetical protein
MTKKATGPGSGRVLEDVRSAFIVCKLSNFDVEDDSLKAEHRNFIKEEIVPIVKRPDALRAYVVGMTSKTGSYDYDRQLGQRRAEHVRTELMLQMPPQAMVPIITSSVSKSQALGRSDVDGQDDRAVVVEVFMKYAPPSPNPNPQPEPNPDPIRPPAYIKDPSGGRIPMYQAASRMVTPNDANGLSFHGGTYVDCVLRGAGTVVNVSFGNDKRTVVTTFNGVTEEFVMVGRLPVRWRFDFKQQGTLASKEGPVSVTCYSDWVDGMPMPSKEEPRKK